MYNCISVFLIATMVMNLTLENLFVFFSCSHVHAIDLRKFLSMSMNLSDNGRLMIVRSTRFEAIGVYLFPF